MSSTIFGRPLDVRTKGIAAREALTVQSLDVHFGTVFPLILESVDFVKLDPILVTAAWEGMLMDCWRFLWIMILGGRIFRPLITGLILMGFFWSYSVVCRGESRM